MNSPIYYAAYRCRLCQEAFERAGTTSDSSVVKDLINKVAGTDERALGAPVMLIDFHSCEDGSYGIGDFLGYRKMKRK